MKAKDILLEKVRCGADLSLRDRVTLASILSLPAILAQLSTVLMQYIDASMVGHLGAAAGASIGLVSTCTWLLGGFCMACVSGFSVQVAHFVGAKQFEKARAVVGQGLVAALFFSLLLGLTAFAISKPLPFWLGGTADIASDAGEYFAIVSLFQPAMMLSWMAAMMLQASGNMKVPSILNVVMCVMDVGFNYLFIYVLGLGVKGAALGTGAAEGVTALLMLFFLLVRSPELKIHRGEHFLRLPQGRFLQTAVSISAPLYLQNIVMRGAYIASTVIVAPLGTIAIAANTFAVTAEGFCYMPGYGIGDAATTLVGQSLGAGRKDLAKRFAWITTFGGMLMMTVFAALMFLFAPQMIRMMSPDTEVVELGARMLRIVAFAETLYGASIVAEGACMGAGDTLAPSFISLGCMWIIRIIPSIFLVKIWGLAGFWIAMTVELNIRGIIFLIRIKGNRWMRRRIVRDEVFN
ncbi:MAG: MATE family efflux transporter [Bacteroidales bacterium]|nr:MATE family efflux transporter [Bacteroidales bacterium]